LDGEGEVADAFAHPILAGGLAPRRRPSDRRKITFMAIGSAPG
jgi:hypothetical protein